MIRKKILAMTLIAVFIASLTFSMANLNSASADSVPYFYSKSTLIQMFMSLYDQYPGIAHYESVGTTTDGNNIWLFAIGNPNGGRILWDGDMHGWEDIGSVIEYNFANWLLTSGDPVAQKIVANNYVMFIPVVNYNWEYTRQNTDYSSSQYGVDLNRNFPTGWTWNDPSDSYSYHGPYPASEPETRAMRYVFQTFHPDYYVNTHYGGAPIFESDYGNTNQISYVFSRINQLSNQFGWTFPFPTKMGNWDGGYAVAEAASFGANAFLFEIADENSPLPTTGNCYWHTSHSVWDIQNYFFPKTLPILIAMAEASGGWTTPSNYVFGNAISTPTIITTPTPTNTATSTSSSALSSSTVGVWHFDEYNGNIAYDISTNQNHGTLYNAGWTTGKSGSGLWFNGATNYVSIPSSASLAGFTEGFSAEAWIKMNDVYSRQMIMSKYNTPGGQMGWFIDYNANRLEFFSSNDGSSYVQAATNFKPTPGTWYHIAVTWQPNQTPTFYINTKINPTSYNTGTINSIYNNAGVPLLIGKCQYDNSRFFNGAIDEVYLYNTAISPSQISQDAGYSNPSSSTLFADNFASGNFNAWSGTTITPNNQITYVTSNFHYQETNTAVFTTMGGYNGNENAYTYKNIPTQTELYALGHVYVMTSGLTWTDSNFYFIRFLSGTTPIAYAGWRMINGAAHWELLLRNGNSWISAYSTSTPNIQQWYSIELHWKADTTNGGGDLYINGQSVASIAGINTAALGNTNTILYGSSGVSNCEHTAIYLGPFTASTNYINP